MTGSADTIKLLVLDIDGTLAGASNQVEPPVLDAIRAVQTRGIPVAIATGRMYGSAMRFHQAVRSTLPLISYQGAYIKDPLTDTLHRHRPVPRHHTLSLIDQLTPMEREQQLSIHLYINDQLHVRDIIDDTQDYAARSQIVPVAVGDLAAFLQANPSLETTKLLALSAEFTLVETLLTQLRQLYPPQDLYFTSSTTNFFEVTHPQANKGEAVKYVAETLLNLTADQVMAIGDNFNDVEMLKYAGIGVAMGDAPAGVKAIADWVAPTVAAHGVAAAITNFLL